MHLTAKTSQGKYGRDIRGRLLFRPHSLKEKLPSVDCKWQVPAESWENVRASSGPGAESARSVPSREENSCYHTGDGDKLKNHGAGIKEDSLALKRLREVRRLRVGLGRKQLWIRGTELETDGWEMNQWECENMSARSSVVGRVCEAVPSPPLGEFSGSEAAACSGPEGFPSRDS